MARGESCGELENELPQDCDGRNSIIRSPSEVAEVVAGKSEHCGIAESFLPLTKHIKGVYSDEETVCLVKANQETVENGEPSEDGSHSLPIGKEVGHHEGCFQGTIPMSNSQEPVENDGEPFEDDSQSVPIDKEVGHHGSCFDDTRSDCKETVGETFEDDSHPVPMSKEVGLSETCFYNAVFESNSRTKVGTDEEKALDVVIAHEAFLKGQESRCSEFQVSGFDVSAKELKMDSYENSRDVSGVKVTQSEQLGKKMDYTGGSESGDLSTRYGLKIEVIDDTAMIEVSKVLKGRKKDKRSVATVGNSEKEAKQDQTTMEESMETSEGKVQNANLRFKDAGNKDKRPKRRAHGCKKGAAIDERETSLCFSKRDARGKIVYSTKEMEALRFVHMASQKKKWLEVYCGFDSEVQAEYDTLLATNNQNQKHMRVEFDPRPQFKVSETPKFLGEQCSHNMEFNIESGRLADSTCSSIVANDIDPSNVPEEFSDDDDTDEDYSSIQRPAFFVTGAPDFDSGPPEDGLEYLRRVRWEAANIPNVKVAEVTRSMQKKEQTAYMPQIPEIADCPEHLLPLKQWEDAFVADFSELRLALSRHEGSSMQVSNRQKELVQMSEDVLQKHIDFVSTGDHSADGLIPQASSDAFSAVAAEMSSSSETSTPRRSVTMSIEDKPTLFNILRMDSVTRALMLRRHMNTVEALSTLSRDDCLWLFALCAAVDYPLDADTSAALRSLLRKCANLRAGKRELDDELVMLNILATIAGRYFGQAGC